MHETMNKMEQQIESSNFAIITLISRTEIKVKSNKKGRLLRGGVLLERNGEKVGVSGTASVLIDCAVLDEAVSFVR